MRPVQTAPVQYDTFKLAGGLDQVTPTLALSPGVARESLNFEVSVTGGYSRIAGYERFDGRPAPSAAAWAILTLSSAAGVAPGNTIANAASTPTATGVVIAVSGSTVVYTKAVGSFSAGATVYVGSTPIGTVVASSPAAQSSYTQALYSSLAADVYRADIQPVPGSGPIRGVASLNGVVYAWRNNAGGTACVIYKSSTSGWQAVSLGYELGFNTGTGTAIAEGDTVSNLAGTATGVVARVVLESGTAWASGSGRLILSSTTGTWAASDQIRVGGVQRATAAGAATQITLQPNGRVETVATNMGGSNSKTRLYGADGVNCGFEFDGQTYVPIKTGMAVDKPNHVAVHKSYLFFSFGPSVQASSIAGPFVWSVVLGANELVLPEDVTCFQSMPGDSSTAALAVYTRHNTYMLYGVAAGGWNLVPFDRGAGAAAYTAETINDAYSLDDRGVTSLTTTRNFGNFDSATLTLSIRPFIQARRNLAVASGVNREKSQYRVFYSDGYALYVTVLNGRVAGAMPVLFPVPVNCWCESDPSTGVETSFFGSGSNNGYVYRMDVGPDFDGVAIGERLRLNFNAQGNARILKRYRRASLEVTGSGYASFNFGYLMGYESTAIDQASDLAYEAPFTISNWDAFLWDAFLWDGRTLSPSEVECNGTAENISLVVSSTSRLNQPYTINSVTLHYSPRRGIR